MIVLVGQKRSPKEMHFTPRGFRTEVVQKIFAFPVRPTWNRAVVDYLLREFVQEWARDHALPPWVQTNRKNEPVGKSVFGPECSDDDIGVDDNFDHLEVKLFITDTAAL